MRVAALYDIHGNLPALEAVLKEVQLVGVQQIVVGGDVLPGPQSNEALATLLELDIPVRFLSGNGEREVLALLAGEKVTVPERYRETMRWVGRQFSDEHVQLLASWPTTITATIQGVGEVLFCHATPRSDSEIFTRLTPDECISPLFSNLDAAVVVCGHTHMPFIRSVGDLQIVNAGSVGMPFGHTGASWLLLDGGIELRHTSYDLAAAAELIRATDYPQADEFATRNVLETPAELDMLERFENAAVR